MPFVAQTNLTLFAGNDNIRPTPGEVAERLNAPVSKTGLGESPAGVRISPSPLFRNAIHNLCCKHVFGNTTLSVPVTGTETGKRTVRLDTVEKLAVALGVQPSQLMPIVMLKVP